MAHQKKLNEVTVSLVPPGEPAPDLPTVPTSINLKDTQRYMSFDVGLKTFSVCVATVYACPSLEGCSVCRGYSVDIERWKSFDIPALLGRNVNLKNLSLKESAIMFQSFLSFMAHHPEETWWASTLEDPQTVVLIETQQKRFGERQRILSILLCTDMVERHKRSARSVQFVNALLKNTDQDNPEVSQVVIPRRPPTTQSKSQPKTATKKKKKKSCTETKNSKQPTNDQPPPPLSDDEWVQYQMTHLNVPFLCSSFSTSSSPSPSHPAASEANKNTSFSSSSSSSSRYKARKDASVRAAFTLLCRTSQSSWLRFFLNHTVSKRDDYADALMQLFYYHLQRSKRVGSVSNQRKRAKKPSVASSTFSAASPKKKRDETTKQSSQKKARVS
jgi:hypothetical protein